MLFNWQLPKLNLSGYFKTITDWVEVHVFNPVKSVFTGYVNHITGIVKELGISVKLIPEAFNHILKIPAKVVANIKKYCIIPLNNRVDIVVTRLNEYKNGIELKLKNSSSYISKVFNQKLELIFTSISSLGIRLSNVIDNLIPFILSKLDTLKQGYLKFEKWIANIGVVINQYQLPFEQKIKAWLFPRLEKSDKVVSSLVNQIGKYEEEAITVEKVLISELTGDLNRPIVINFFNEAIKAFPTFSNEFMRNITEIEKERVK